MTSPIINQIGAVFIPVSDMQRAIAWYSRLLGLPTRETSHEGTIYDLTMRDGAGVILDANKREVHNSSQPLFFFWTDDMRAAHQFLRDNQVEIVSKVEDIGSVSFLIFKDPDHNLLMVCQRNG